jgi:hypothetical protein
MLDYWLVEEYFDAGYSVGSTVTGFFKLMAELVE